MLLVEIVGFTYLYSLFSRVTTQSTSTVSISTPEDIIDVHIKKFQDEFSLNDAVKWISENYSNYLYIEVAVIHLFIFAIVYFISKNRQRQLRKRLRISKALRRMDNIRKGNPSFIAPQYSGKTKMGATPLSKFPLTSANLASTNYKLKNSQINKFQST